MGKDRHVNAKTRRVNAKNVECEQESRYRRYQVKLWKYAFH